ncbi:hypothetical protein N1851_006609 [Merluccius polli]|uniref:Reverse transcriptase zinc-binding domain-containing protein n=1 Tax=Merluccius polli TaxID=89951 RepID=A0AA47N430_MERPO|nr:hypothetical protein N1851_006609 [Merluccius polli]
MDFRSRQLVKFSCVALLESTTRDPQGPEDLEEELSQLKLPKRSHLRPQEGQQQHQPPPRGCLVAGGCLVDESEDTVHARLMDQRERVATRVSLQLDMARLQRELASLQTRRKVCEEKYEKGEMYTEPPSHTNSPTKQEIGHRRVKWPAANNKEWLKLDEDVDKCLESISKGSVDQKLQTMCTIIMKMGAERFGVEERRGDSNPAKLHQREAKISQLRQELKSLRRQFKLAKEEERTALSELTNIIRKRLISLRRAERHRRKGKERARKHSAFIGNPFGFTKKLLGQKRSGHLACPVEKIDNHLHATFSDTLRDHNLGPCRDLVAPVKSLGKIFDSSLKDSAAIKQTKCDLTTWLTAIDRSGLPGKFKAWIYQHGVFPRILWPLLVYEVPTSTVEALEKSISQFLRKWLGLPRSLSSIALYGHSTKLHLPLSGLTEEFKRGVESRDSRDTKVAAAGILVKTGRKWHAQEAVTKAEVRLRHKTLVDSVATGRAGLGCFPKPRYDLARGKERRRLIQDEIRAEVEEERYTKMAGMSKQGAWTRWEHADPRRITWAELWKAEPLRIKFFVQSIYDVLPSPANLHTWGLEDTPECKLCQKRGTLEHILSSCSKALGEGRYRWRHDQVLKALADSICMAIQHSKTQAAPKQSITFIRAGQKEQHHRPSSTGGLLTTARDWQLQVDLVRQLKFPGNITATSLCPDMVLTSESTKQVVILELTVPWEDRIEEAHGLSMQSSARSAETAAGKLAVSQSRSGAEASLAAHCCEPSNSLERKDCN